MEQKAKGLSKNGTLVSVQCVLLIFISVALLSWIVFGLRPIQESMVPLDCLQGFVFKLEPLCSNSAFLLLVCNLIIGALMALSKSSESHDIYRAYFKESESRRKQADFAEGKILVHGAADIIECTEICSVENVAKLEMEGGDICSDRWEEKSMAASGWAVVSYQGDISNEEPNKKCDEFNKQCDEFIAKFYRQMSLQERQS